MVKRMIWADVFDMDLLQFEEVPDFRLGIQ